jgi:hypothetical protein
LSIITSTGEPAIVVSRAIASTKQAILSLVFPAKEAHPDTQNSGQPGDPD